MGDDFRVRYNTELYEFLSDLDVAQRINIQFSAVVRMRKDAPVRRIFDAGNCESRRKGRPCIRCKHQIEEALSSICVTNWRRRLRSRVAWKDVLQKVEIC